MRILLTTLCASLALASGAVAQTAPDTTQLHDALHLSSGQESAWKAYTAAIAPNSAADARQQATEQMLPKLTTPRRIALLNADMAQNLADLQKRGQAVTAFYAQLTLQQQKVFDTQTLPPSQGN